MDRKGDDLEVFLFLIPLHVKVTRERFASLDLSIYEY